MKYRPQFLQHSLLFWIEVFGKTEQLTNELYQISLHSAILLSRHRCRNTKSFFVQTWLCPKGAWLKNNKPEAAVINENTIARIVTKTLKGSKVSINV